MKFRISEQPVAYANAVKAILAMIVILGWVTLTGEQVASIVVAAEAVLGIVVWNAVTPNATVDKKVAEATETGAADKELEIRQFLSAVKAAKSRVKEEVDPYKLLPPPPSNPPAWVNEPTTWVPEDLPDTAGQPKEEDPAPVKKSPARPRKAAAKKAVSGKPPAKKAVN